MYENVVASVQNFLQDKEYRYNISVQRIPSHSSNAVFTVYGYYIKTTRAWGGIVVKVLRY
jgi:hypothetical protein